MNKFGAVLDDFGLETMLQKLMEEFIRPISTSTRLIPAWDVNFFKELYLLN